MEILICVRAVSHPCMEVCPRCDFPCKGKAVIDQKNVSNVVSVNPSVPYSALQKRKDRVLWRYGAEPLLQTSMSRAKMITEKCVSCGQCGKLSVWSDCR